MNHVELAIEQYNRGEIDYSRLDVILTEHKDEITDDMYGDIFGVECIDLAVEQNKKKLEDIYEIYLKEWDDDKNVYPFSQFVEDIGYIPLKEWY